MFYFTLISISLNGTLATSNVHTSTLFIYVCTVYSKLFSANHQTDYGINQVSTRIYNIMQNDLVPTHSIRG